MDSSSVLLSLTLTKVFYCTLRKCKGSLLSQRLGPTLPIHKAYCVYTDRRGGEPCVRLRFYIVASCARPLLLSSPLYNSISSTSSSIFTLLLCLLEQPIGKDRINGFSNLHIHLRAVVRRYPREPFQAHISLFLWQMIKMKPNAVSESSRVTATLVKHACISGEENSPHHWFDATPLQHSSLPRVCCTGAKRCPVSKGGVTSDTGVRAV